MSLQIIDLVVSINSNNVGVPVPNASILYEPVQLPVFIKTGSIFRELGPAHVRSTATDNTGAWTLVLPWPSESDPGTVQWIITLPDKTKWVGRVPEGVAGPVTLHTLKTTYEWGPVVNQNDLNQIVVNAGNPGQDGAKGDPTFKNAGRAVFNGSTNSVDVVFSSSMAADNYHIEYSIVVTAGEGPVQAWFTNVTQDGMTINVYSLGSETFTGAVPWAVWE